MLASPRRPAPSPVGCAFALRPEPSAGHPALWHGARARAPGPPTDPCPYSVPRVPGRPPPGPRPWQLMSALPAVRLPCVLGTRRTRRLGVVHPHHLPPRLAPGPGPAGRRRPRPRCAGPAPATAAPKLFPQAPDRDTIPIASRPPVCACLSRVRRRQVRHAQAGRFSSTRFTRRAHPRDRDPMRRRARRIKAYSLGQKIGHDRQTNGEEDT